jgi:hypothetical protein
MLEYQAMDVCHNPKVHFLTYKFGARFLECQSPLVVS